MTAFILISAFVIAFILIYGWIKVINFFFKRFENKAFSKIKSSEPINPYIEAQKAKDLNDKQYEEYLQYMAENGSGVPFDKLKTKEEQRAESVLKKVI